MPPMFCDICGNDFPNRWEHKLHLSSIQHHLRMDEIKRGRHYCHLCMVQVEELADYIKHVNTDGHNANMKKCTDHCNAASDRIQNSSSVETEVVRPSASSVEPRNESQRKSFRGRKFNERSVDGPQEQLHGDNWRDHNWSDQFTFHDQVLSSNAQHQQQLHYAFPPCYQSSHHPSQWASWNRHSHHVMPDPNPEYANVTRQMFERNGFARSSFPMQRPSVSSNFSMNSGLPQHNTQPSAPWNSKFARVPPSMGIPPVPYQRPPTSVQPTTHDEMDFQINSDEIVQDDDHGVHVASTSLDIHDSSNDKEKSAPRSSRSNSSRSVERVSRLTRNTTDRKTMPTRISKRNTEKELEKKITRSAEKRTRSTSNKEIQSPPVLKRGLLSRLSIRVRKDKDAAIVGEKHKSKDDKEEKRDSAAENTPPTSKKLLKKKKVMTSIAIEDKTKKWDKVAKKNMPSFLKSRSQKMFENRTKKYCLTDDKGVTVEEPADILQQYPDRVDQNKPLRSAIWGTGSEVMKSDRMNFPESLTRPPPTRGRIPTHRKTRSVSASLRNEAELPPLSHNLHDQSAEYATLLTPSTSKNVTGNPVLQSDSAYSIDISGVFADVESAIQAANKNANSLNAESGSSSSPTDTSMGNLSRDFVGNAVSLATSATRCYSECVSTSNSNPSPAPTSTSDSVVVKPEPTSQIELVAPPATALPCPIFTPHPNRATGVVRPSSNSSSNQFISHPSLDTSDDAQSKKNDQSVVKQEILDLTDQSAQRQKKTAQSVSQQEMPTETGLGPPDQGECRELWTLVEQQYEVQKKIYAHHMKMEQLASLITAEKLEMESCQKKLAEIEGRKRQIMRQRTPPAFDPSSVKLSDLPKTNLMLPNFNCFPPFSNFNQESFGTE